MTEISPSHLLIVFIVVTLLIPIQQIVKRAGYSRWWILLAFIPMVNWIALWFLAFKRWPAVDKKGAAIAAERR